MFTQKKFVIGGVLLGALALVLLGGAVFWYTQLRGDAPANVSITEAVRSVVGPSGSQGTTDSLQGTWEIVSGSDSFVGYRVQEELRNIGSNTAVGRTMAVTGRLQFDGQAIRTVEVQADLTQLQSDNSLRDGQLRRQALETNTYPTASFVLAQPAAVDRIPAEGETVTVPAVGDLTIHGVTRRVTIPLQGQIKNGLVVVIGSTNIEFSDYNIVAPRAASVLSVQERAVLEIQLVLEKETV